MSNLFTQKMIFTLHSIKFKLSAYLYVVQLFFTIFDRHNRSVQLIGNVGLPFLEIMQDTLDDGFIFLELDERIIETLL